jgi:hypothetical protein
LLSAIETEGRNFAKRRKRKKKKQKDPKVIKLSTGWGK